MGRNMQVAIVDPKGIERATHRITYGARLTVDEGQPIKRGERVSEWNPNSLPILTEVDGIVRYGDIVEGLSLKEEADETTGVTQKKIIDWCPGSKGASDWRPAITNV